ncbi:hypothetical protein BKA64DRAFT_678591 [Cadophora sp. MPI-SDFR-AT-0126]|nr:hypothetical protein BKA64DRAFT_678591 [Leotiomycetes sp. MPI-SDFR-AT-0126]
MLFCFAFVPVSLALIGAYFRWHAAWFLLIVFQLSDVMYDYKGGQYGWTPKHIPYIISYLFGVNFGWMLFP